MKKVILSLLPVAISFAHIKPFPHSHIGFFHIEDFLIILGVLLLSALGFITYRKLSGRKT